MSDIRKIQTGNNQYTLHARVSDKLAVNAQIGSTTKPVYVDSSGQVKACSREIPTGMTIDTKLSATSGNAVSNKVITEALNGKNPKAKADFIASSDLTALPITSGILDLNGYTLTLSGTTQLTGTLTIKNGTIGGEGIISSEDAVFYIYDCQLYDSAKISISCIMFVTDNLYYSHVLGDEIYITMPTLSLNNKTIALISNSSCIRIKGQLTSADDFGTSFITNSTFIIIQNIAINIKTSNDIFLSGVICTHIDSCSNVQCIPQNIPDFGIDQLDQNSIVEISNCIFDDGTNTSLMMQGWYDVQNHRYSRFEYVSSIKGYDTNNFYGLPTTNAILDYLKNYAKKDEISKVYKYKGTKTNYSELTTSGNNIGDVWNITNADTANHIKAGDNVVWDGSKWDNLSGTVANVGYAERIGTDKSHPQIGSPTKPVYVDSSGQVKACSREIPTGMTIDSVLNDTSVNAVQNKVINAALKGKNPKAKADFIASSDLTALPITAGVLDLNGYTLTLSGTTQLTGTLTIKNGTIGGNGTLQSFREDDENSIYNFIYINDCKLINQMKLNLQSYFAILNNIHGTVVTLDGEEYKYANLEFLFFGYITNFSNISVKSTNLEWL